MLLLTPAMIGRGADTSYWWDLTGLLWFSWRISEQGVPVHGWVSRVGDVQTSGRRRLRRGMRPTKQLWYVGWGLSTVHWQRQTWNFLEDDVFLSIKILRSNAISIQLWLIERLKLKQTFYFQLKLLLWSWWKLRQREMYISPEFWWPIISKSNWWTAQAEVEFGIISKSTQPTLYSNHKPRLIQIYIV